MTNMSQPIWAICVSGGVVAIAAGDLAVRGLFRTLDAISGSAESARQVSAQGVTR